nr:uncharacterized protein LOC124813939 [Hydra vulgaris]
MVKIESREEVVIVGQIKIKAREEVVVGGSKKIELREEVVVGESKEIETRGGVLLKIPLVICCIAKGVLLPDIDCLEVQFNTDGLPFFKSSRTSLWPILGMLKKNVIKTVFAIGVFCGQEKPSSAVEFFEDFVKETLSLLHNGLLINGKHFTLNIHSFVCDTPARAFVKGIKYHSGYNSCEKCVQVGDYVGKVIFPQLNACLRTDISFNEMSDEDHHKSPYA